MTRRLLATSLLTLVLAAGCGGDDESSATTDWADGVCSALSAWNDTVVATVESVQPGSGGDVEAAVDDLAEATRTLGDDLRALGPPETESGDDAEQALDELATAAEAAVSKVQTDVEGASGASGLAQAVASVGAALSTLGEQLSATFNELEQLDPGGELEDAFAEADACEELRESRS
jgi:hypothetical protein